FCQPHRDRGTFRTGDQPAVHRQCQQTGLGRYGQYARPLLPGEPPRERVTPRTQPYAGTVVLQCDLDGLPVRRHLLRPQVAVAREGYPLLARVDGPRLAEARPAPVRLDRQFPRPRAYEDVPVAFAPVEE